LQARKEKLRQIKKWPSVTLLNIRSSVISEVQLIGTLSFVTSTCKEDNSKSWTTYNQNRGTSWSDRSM